MFFFVVGKRRNHNSRDNQRRDIGLIMEPDDIHHAHAGNLGDKRIMGQAGIQHAAISSAFDSRRRHRRMNSGRHHQRHKNRPGGGRRPRRARQGNIDGIGGDYHAGNQNRPNFCQPGRHEVDQMLVAFRVFHDHRKAHDGTNRLDQAAIGHAFGEGVQRSHRRSRHTGHDNAGGQQNQPRIIAFDKKINRAKY